MSTLTTATDQSTSLAISPQLVTSLTTSVMMTSRVMSGWVPIATIMAANSNSRWTSTITQVTSTLIQHATSASRCRSTHKWYCRSTQVDAYHLVDNCTASFSDRIAAPDWHRIGLS